MLIPNSISKDKKKVFLGIEILRVILCFWVISFHSIQCKIINTFLLNVIKTKLFHVPCFSFMSFYFSYNIFRDKNIFKFKKRLQRLIIPYVLWPIIIFAIDNISNRKIIIPFNHLIIQLICGRKILIPLWYLFVIIFLTIFFFILSSIIQNHFLFVIQIISIFSYFYQYSGFYHLFDIFLDNAMLPIPIIDTLDIIPLSTLGFIFSELKIVEILCRKRKTTLFFSFLFIYFLFKFDIFINLGGYKGIIHIFVSTFFFLGFVFLPLENTPHFIQNIIKEITRYTNGIYCLQDKMIPFINDKFKNYSGTFKNCIIIYLLSYFFSFIGNKLTGKTQLKYLFI